MLLRYAIDPVDPAGVRSGPTRVSAVAELKAECFRLSADCHPKVKGQRSEAEHQGFVQPDL